MSVEDLLFVVLDFSILGVLLGKLVKFLRLHVMRMELSWVNFLVRFQSVLACLSGH